MAKVSPLIAIMSGSVGGNTWSRNKGGLYVKMKGVPTNPNSSRQQAVRGFLSTGTVDWAALGPDERNAWDTWAAEHPLTDPLGQEYFRTGHQAFVGLRARALDQGLTPNDDPPALGVPGTLLSLAVTFTSDTAISIVWTPTPLGAAIALYAWMGPPQVGAGDPNFAQAVLIGYSAQAAAAPAAFTLPRVVISGWQANFWVGLVDGDGQVGVALKDNQARP